IRGGRVLSVSLLLGGEGEVTEIMAEKDSPIVGKPLHEINLPKGIIIGAVLHDQEVIIPDGDTVIYENDRMVIFTLASDLGNLKNLLQAKKKGGLVSGFWKNR
ncbi:MAG: hypothetical protein L0I93_02000, partial [Atopostipes suicloacalis]|nr:hypothetical protein [Atopostipes suicloacalis]